MMSRLILPLATMGVASAMIASGMLAQPQASEALPSTRQAHSSQQARRSATPQNVSTAQASATVASSEASSDATAEQQESPNSPAAPTASDPESQPGTDNQSAEPTPTQQSESQKPAQHSQSDAETQGWTIDYFDGFDTPIEETKWERYGWGDPAVGHGAMGVMSQENSLIQDGKLLIRTQYKDGKWSAGGAGSREIFSASYGRWEVRAKFPEAKGIGYAFLLWPEDGSWPPEIDFAEGRVNGPEVMGVYHWDPDNKQEQRFFDNKDMSGWHTYGVIVDPDRITFTFDGQPWGEIEHPNVTDKRMWIGFQTGAMDPYGWQNDTETVDNGVPGPLTPEVADIEIDYVAHYNRG